MSECQCPPGDPGLPATQTEQLLSELEGAEGLGPNQLLCLDPFAAGITRKMPLTVLDLKIQHIFLTLEGWKVQDRGAHRVSVWRGPVSHTWCSPPVSSHGGEGEVNRFHQSSVRISSWLWRDCPHAVINLPEAPTFSVLLGFPPMNFVETQAFLWISETQIEPWGVAFSLRWVLLKQHCLNCRSRQSPFTLLWEAVFSMPSW